MKIKFLLALLIFCSSSSYGRDLIMWQVVNWPPFMMVDQAEGKVKGLYSPLLEVLQEKLPGYEHKNIEMPWSRLWHDLEHGKHVCNIFAFKSPERERFTEFSVPVSIFLSNHIIIKQRALKELGLENRQSLSLKELISMSEINGGLESTRSYSGPLDKILNEYKHNSNVKRLPLKSENLIRMLLLDRIGYTLEYPIAALYWEEKHAKQLGQLTYIPIEEAISYAWVYVACPKNDWGKELIKNINKIVVKERAADYYRKTMESTAANQRQIEIIRNAYGAFVRASE